MAAELDAVAPEDTIVGSLVVGNAPSWLDLHDATLYVNIGNASTIKALDVGDGVPTLLGTVTVGSGTAWIKRSGNYLYATDQNSLALRTVSVADPTAMTVVSTVTYDASGASGGGRFAIGRDGRYMVVGGPELGANINKAYVVDLVDPTLPVVRGSVTTGSIHRGVCQIADAYFALASRDDHTVRIINIGNPAAPVVDATITTTQSNTTAAVCFRYPYLFIGNYGNGTTGGFEIWNVSAPASPTLESKLAIVGGSEQMVIQGNYVYIGSRTNFVCVVVDVTDVTAPVVAASLAAGSERTPGVAVRNNIVYRVSTEGSANGKVYALDTSDATLLTESTATPGTLTTHTASPATLTAA